MGVSFWNLMVEKRWFRFLKTLILSFLMFLLLSIIFFAILGVLEYGFTILALQKLGLSKLGLFNIFQVVQSIYERWWAAINEAVLVDKFKVLYLIPFIAIFLSISFFIYLCFREFSNKSKKYFPNLQELTELNIFGNASMVFGRIKDVIIKPSRSSSALVCFGEDLGKTVSVAIPSIFESNNTNLVAVDTTGTLAKLTSGYRASFSKVFNFDWNKLDDYQKGEVYPRWNPLALGNMPKNEGKNRDNYILSLAKYLIVKSGNDYWEDIAVKTLESLIHYFIYKVEHTKANDYFLSSILESENGLSKEDIDILYSYYSLIDINIVGEAVDALEAGELDEKSYIPVGSWYGVPSEWHGKELSFAMVVDTLISMYCVASREDNEQYAWRDMLDDFIYESNLFAYPQEKLKIFKYLINLTIRQRKVVFGIILEALTVFRKKSVRERTSLSDFRIKDARGIVNQETGQREFVSIYASSNTENSVFMTSFFVDVLLAMNIHVSEEKSKTPVLFVIDDFESLPKFKLLPNALKHTNKSNISVMLLANNIETIDYIYSPEELEVILNKTEYKLFSESDNITLSKHLDLFSKVLKKTSQVGGDKLWYQKTQTYEKVSKEMLSTSFESEISKGKYLLMADSFYGRPIKLESMFFMMNDEMREKAEIKEKLMLDKILLKYRNKMDIDIPFLPDIIENILGKRYSSEEIDDIIKVKKEVLVENISRIKDVSFSNRKISKKIVKNEYKTIDDIKEEKWWHGEETFFSDNDLIKKIES